MSTPRKNKNYNYTSPYSKPTQQQYPSQNEEYISFDMGGRSDHGNATVNKCNQRRGNHPNYLSNPYNNQQKQWCTPRKNKDETYRSKNNGKSENAAISSYVHPSMTEDPWLCLMKRIESIGKSSISLKMEDESLESMDLVSGEDIND